MSHARGSRHQKLKHHVRRQVRNLHRFAAITATMTAATAPLHHARADGARSAVSTRPQRATLPLNQDGNTVQVDVSFVSAKTPNAPAPRKIHEVTGKQPAVKSQAAKAPSAASAAAPQISQSLTASVASSIAKSNGDTGAQSVRPSQAVLLATKPQTEDRVEANRPLLAQASGSAVQSARVESARVESTPAKAAPVPAKAANDKRVLLAQLDAELRQTEVKLKATDEKLSDGQRELMGLSNTLRSVMIEDGQNAAGLHPFVRIASRYAGTPYVWGGESRYGFDCSGFIIRVMRDLGYKALPHSAAEQFKYGKPIAQPLLKPGDLVFFANTYKPGISHVGIYIGKRKFIHAANTRQGTIVSSLDESLYRQKYAGARRLMAVKR